MKSKAQYFILFKLIKAELGTCTDNFFKLTVEIPFKILLSNLLSVSINDVSLTIENPYDFKIIESVICNLKKML